MSDFDFKSEEIEEFFLSTLDISLKNFNECWIFGSGAVNDYAKCGKFYIEWTRTHTGGAIKSLRVTAPFFIDLSNDARYKIYKMLNRAKMIKAADYIIENSSSKSLRSLKRGFKVKFNDSQANKRRADFIVWRMIRRIQLTHRVIQFTSILERPRILNFLNNLDQKVFVNIFSRSRHFLSPFRHNLHSL